MAADDAAGALVVLVAGDVPVAAWRMAATTPPDLWVVDRLARLHLAARRLGLSIRVQTPCPRLSELLDLVGLADLLGDGLDARWQSEGSEQLGVQEVVQPGDPSV